MTPGLPEAGLSVWALPAAGPLNQLPQRKVCLKAGTGWTEIFIYPGYRFKVLDALITNFHLPQSTLVMLVSALAGREHILDAYREAVKEGYRFFLL